MQTLNSQIIAKLLNFTDTERNVTTTSASRAMDTFKESKFLCNETTGGNLVSVVDRNFYSKLHSYLMSSMDVKNCQPRFMEILNVLCVLSQHNILCEVDDSTAASAYRALIRDLLSFSLKKSRDYFWFRQCASVINVLDSKVLFDLYLEKLSDWLKFCFKNTDFEFMNKANPTFHYFSEIFQFVESIPTYSSTCSDALRLAGHLSHKLYDEIAWNIIQSSEQLFDIPKEKLEFPLEKKRVIAICRLLVFWDELSCRLVGTYHSGSLFPVGSDDVLNTESAENEDDSEFITVSDQVSSIVKTRQSRGFAAQSVQVSSSEESPAPRLKGVLKNRTIDQTTEVTSPEPLVDPSANFDLLHVLLVSTKAFPRACSALINTAKLLSSNLRIATDPIRICYSRFDENPHSRELPSCVYSLLLQNPVFGTSTQGPIFTRPGISVVDASIDAELVSQWDQRAHSSCTAQSTMNSWVGVTGIACGLPFPALSVSESVSDFISVIGFSVLPCLLSLMKSDLRHSVAYIASAESFSGVDPSGCYTNDESIEDESKSFKFTVLSILKIVVDVLNCVNPSSSSGSISQQISALLLNAHEDENGIERLAWCISDCLLLRSLGHLLSMSFSGEYSIASSLVGDSKTGFQANRDMSTLLNDSVKQYDAAVRLLSENLVDLCLLRNETVVVPTLLNFPLVLADIGYQQLQTVGRYLTNLWNTLSLTCPSGLARQIMAQVSAQLFSSCNLLLCSEKYLSKLDGKRLENALRYLLCLVKFSLFVSSETTAEVAGTGLLPDDIAVLHSCATAFAQTLVCRCTPSHVWSNFHGDGFYRNTVFNEETTFEFCASNWLCFADSELFPDPPFQLLRDNRDQTELELNFELFAAGRHFEPLKLLYLIAPNDADLCIRLLTFVDSDECSATVENKLDLFHDVFRVCSLVPGLEMFFCNLLGSIFKRSGDPFVALDTSVPQPHLRWPVWFRAMISLLDEPLKASYDAFKDIVQKHVAADEALSSAHLKGVSSQSARILYANHLPQQKHFWTELFPQGHLPCECPLPQAPLLKPLPVGGDSVEPKSEAVNYDSQRIAVTWKMLACDLLRSVVLKIPPGIQLVCKSIERVVPTEVIRGGFFGMHLVLANIFLRIHQEVVLDEVERLQLLILWEHLCAVLESSVDQDINGCKKRVLKYMDDLDSSFSEARYPEEYGLLGKRLQYTNYIELIQSEVLPELFSLYTFFKCNTKWIRATLRRKRVSPDSGSMLDCGTVLHFNSQLGSVNQTVDYERDILLDPPQMFEQKLDWQKLGLINIGLTAEVVLRMRNFSLEYQPSPIAT